MSSSEEDTKIDLLDSPANINKKLKRAFCEPGNIENNGILSFAKHVVFPLFKPGEKYVVPRRPENGGDIEFEKYEDLESSYAKEEIHPADLKGATEIYINRLLEPIRKTFENPELQKLSDKAYPASLTSKKCFNYDIHVYGMNK